MNSIKNNIDLLMDIKEVSRNQKLNYDEIKILQEKKLKKLLRYVLTHSKFYKEYYGERGITIDKIDEISLEDLPIIDKKIVMENFDDLVCDKNLKIKELKVFINNPDNRNKKYKNCYKVITTSGSSGEVGIFVNNSRELNHIKALDIQRVSRSKLRILKKIKVAFIGATEGSYAGVSLVKDLPKLFCEVLTLNVNSPVQDIIEKINRFQPEVLTGYASGIYMLAQEQIKGNISINPSKIISSGDMLTDFMREEIKEAFKVDPINFYAASESIGMASECETHHRIHLFNDFYCFEVVDKDLKIVPPGETGNLIVTNLFNYTQPLIRYKMNDEVAIDESPCGCGLPFPVLKNISGRQEEFLCFEKSDGTRACIHPIVLVGFYAVGLIKYKFIQLTRDSILMKAVINGDKEEVINEINSRMNEILKSIGLDKEVTFSVEIVSDIENDKKTGKFKLIVPLR